MCFINDLLSKSQYLKSKLSSPNGFDVAEAKQQIRMLQLLAADLSSNIGAVIWSKEEKMTVKKFEKKHGSGRSDLRMLRECKDHGLISYEFSTLGQNEHTLSVALVGINGIEGQEVGETYSALTQSFWDSPMGAMVIDQDSKYRDIHAKLPQAADRFELEQILDASVEGIASSLTDEHLKRQQGLIRLKTILQQ